MCDVKWGKIASIQVSWSLLCRMLLHFSIVVSQQGKSPQELWAQLRHAVQGFCMLLSLFLAAMADDGSSRICVTQQGAWWLSGSGGVRMETENWLLCGLKAANAKSSDLDQEGRVCMNRFSQKDRTSFFFIFSDGGLPCTTSL